jgi:hypothetical protein
LGFLCKNKLGIGKVEVVYDNYRAMGLCVDSGFALIKGERLNLEMMPLGAVFASISA